MGKRWENTGKLAKLIIKNRVPKKNKKIFTTDRTKQNKWVRPLELLNHTTIQTHRLLKSVVNGSHMSDLCLVVNI